MSTLTRKPRYATLHLPRLKYPVRPESSYSHRRYRHQNDPDRTGWASGGQYGKNQPLVLECSRGRHICHLYRGVIQHTRPLFASEM